MFFSSIAKSLSSNSGDVLYPKDKDTILTTQLNPPSEEKTTLHSTIRNEDIEVWSKAAEDLPRLGNFGINGETKANPSKGIAPRAEQVFDSILADVGNIETTQSVVNLLNQGLLLKAQEKVITAKGFETKDGYMTHIPTGMDKSYQLETDVDGRFTLIEERVFRCSPIDNPMEGTPLFFKAKVIVSGTRKDLADRNVKQLNLKIIYTKNHSSYDAAKKASYFGNSDSLSDCSTYLK